MGSNRPPSLPEVLRAHVEAGHKARYGGWLPGRIESYDSVKHKASVQLLLEDTVTDESGNESKKLIPIINEVPVQTLGDGFGVRIELALKQGDYVTVLFAARSTDRWVQQGGIVDPDDARDHDLNDAICIPGLFDFAHVKKADANITFTASEVQIGGTKRLLTEDDAVALKNAIASAAVASGDGGATFKTNIGTSLASWPTGTHTLKGG